MDRGQIGDSRIVKFTRSGNKVLLVQPNYAYRAVSNNPDERKSVEEAFAQSVIWGFEVKAQDDTRVLIDFTDILLRDSNQVGRKLKRAKQGDDFKADPSRSAIYLQNTKSFPDNTEFETKKTKTKTRTDTKRSSVTPNPD